MNDDLVASILGIGPGGRLAALRAERPSIRDHSQGAYEQLVLPPDPGGLSQVERAALALRVALIENHAALADRYRIRLAAIGTEADLDAAQAFPAPTDSGRLALLLRYADLVATDPARCDQSDIDALTAYGLSPQDIVAVTQLVAFVPYQVRLLVGLTALRDEARQ